MTSREGAQDHISEATRCIENVGDITEWGEGKEHSWRRFHFDPITPIEQAINATLEEKRTIAITKRGNGFDARLKDNPDRRGYGPTVMAAIGNLVFFHNNSARGAAQAQTPLTICSFDRGKPCV